MSREPWLFACDGGMILLPSQYGGVRQGEAMTISLLDQMQFVLTASVVVLAVLTLRQLRALKADSQARFAAALSDLSAAEELLASLADVSCDTEDHAMDRHRQLNVPGPRGSDR